MEEPQDDLEKVLSCVFNHISLQSFDKCREIVEREKDNKLVCRSGQIRQLLILLVNFIEAERSYFNIGFMSTKKIFLRKDNSLKFMYESLRADLNKLEESGDGVEKINILINCIGQYIIGRVHLIDCYEKIYLTGTGQNKVGLEDFVSDVELVVDTTTFAFVHPLLKPLKDSLINECHILMHLFGALVELQNWSFIPSLMHLHSAHTKLNTWEKSLQIKESWKLGFGTSFLKGSQLPALYQWLQKFRSAAVNKFTLYFYHVLSQQTTPQEMKNYISTKHNTDFYIKFQNLQKKCFASCALLLFHPTGLADWSGPGFQHPDRSKEEQSLSQYIVMLAHPLKYTDRVVGISRALSEKHPPASLDRVETIYNPEEKCSYFICGLDTRVTLVTVFDMKKDERDVNVINYLNEFCAQVKCLRLFTSLKVGK